MKLVEQFIDFVHWPASRKISLLGCLSVPTTALAALLNRYLQSLPSQHETVAIAMLDPYLIAWLVSQVVATGIGFVMARASREANWVAYVYVCANIPFIVAIIYLYGMMSTPLVAIIPTIVILWALYFNERIAWFGFFLMVGSLIAIHLLQVAGKLSYAPILIDRSIDAQRSPVWFAAALTATLILFSFAFSICLLILAARRLQETRLQDARNALERSTRLIRRYLPTQLAEQIVQGLHDGNSRPERRKLTIVFSEIEGFTEATEALQPASVAEVLNEYLSAMMLIADHHGATVNHMVGDSIMMFFGAPHATSDRDHALRAVRMAMDMQRRMRELEPLWRQRGLQRPLRTRIGINTGYASVGDFGSEGRKLYTAIGVQTNLAARIQSHCQPGRVLISHPTWALVQEQIPTVPMGELQFKGLHYAVSVYEVFDTPGAPE